MDTKPPARKREGVPVKAPTNHARTVPLGPPVPSFPPTSVMDPYGEGVSTMKNPPTAGLVGRNIELLVVDETQLPGMERRVWRAAEIWTKRRVYGLDSTFRCFEILDRSTGKNEESHDMLGARLGGGRLRERDTVRFSYPLPLPGMEAMFMRGKKHGYTSAVERMIVRIRVLHTSADDQLPTWEEIQSRWSEPPPR